MWAAKHLVNFLRRFPRTFSEISHDIILNNAMTALYHFLSNPIIFTITSGVARFFGSRGKWSQLPLVTGITNVKKFNLTLLLFGSTVNDFLSAGNQFFLHFKIYFPPHILQSRAAPRLPPASPECHPIIQRHIQSESGLLTLPLSESHKTTNSYEVVFLLLDFHSDNSAEVS